MHPAEREGSAIELDAWLSSLGPEDLQALLGQFRKLQAGHSGLQSELELSRQRATDLELKLDALELDSQRVHRFLDEFDVPRHLQAESPGERRQDTELSLLGRIELVLEDEEE